MVNFLDQSVVLPKQRGSTSGLKVLTAVIGLGLTLFAVGSVIVLSLIPLYINERDLENVATCGTCTVSVRNSYTNANQVANDLAVGSYSCAAFCSGTLGTGAPGSEDPTYNFLNDATTALGGVSYTCNLALTSGGNCVTAYGSSATFAGQFYLSNGGSCASPYSVLKCCCRR